MASKLLNLVRQTTPTIGTGTMSLGSVIGGYLSFANAGISNGDVVDYCILDGSNSEIGFGAYTAGVSPTTVAISSDHYIINGLTFTSSAVPVSVSASFANGFSIVAAFTSASGYTILWQKTDGTVEVDTCDSSCNLISGTGYPSRSDPAVQLAIAGPTLTRTVTKSTNGNALLSLTGSAQVGIWPRAETIADASRFSSGNIAVSRLSLFLANQNAFTAQQYTPRVALTFATTQTWDVAAAPKAKIIMTANSTMAAVTNAVEGGSYSCCFIQDGTGNRQPDHTVATGAGSFDFGTSPRVFSLLPNTASILYWEALNIGGTLKLRYAGSQMGFV